MASITQKILPDIVIKPIIPAANPIPVISPSRGDWKNQLDNAAHEVIGTIFHEISFSEFYHNKLIPSDFSDRYPNIAKFIGLLLKDLEVGNVNSFEIRIKRLPNQLRLPTQAIAYEMAKVLSVTSVHVKTPAEKVMEMLLPELNTAGLKDFSLLKWKSDTTALDTLEATIYKESSLRNRKPKQIRLTGLGIITLVLFTSALAGLVYRYKPKEEEVPQEPVVDVPSTNLRDKIITYGAGGMVALFMGANFRFCYIDKGDHKDYIKQERERANFIPQPQKVIGSLKDRYEFRSKVRKRILTGLEKAVNKRGCGFFGYGINHLGWSVASALHSCCFPLPIVVQDQDESRPEGYASSSPPSKELSSIELQLAYDLRADGKGSTIVTPPRSNSVQSNASPDPGSPDTDGEE